MYSMKNVYFKSFGRRKEGSPLEISIFDPIRMQTSTSQTLREVLEARVIRPNTKHSKLPVRLSVSMPTPDFPGTYRPEGILFTTKTPLTYCVPLDLMALTNGQTFTSQDYWSDFLSGYEGFVFQGLDLMKDFFPDSKSALDAINVLRESQGLPLVPKQMDYNEVCFENEVKIKPVGLVGISPELVQLGLENKLPVYSSIDGHFSNISHPIRHPIKKWRELVHLALGSMFVGYQGLAQEREIDFK